MKQPFLALGMTSSNSMTTSQCLAGFQ